MALRDLLISPNYQKQMLATATPVPVDRPKGETGGPATITMDEALRKFNFVHVDAEKGYILAEDKEFDPQIDKELGYQGVNTLGLDLRQEYNTDLIDDAAILKYIEMRNDSQVRAALRLIKTPIFSARWFIDPASNDPVDVEAAEFIEWNLFEGLSYSWPALLTEILYMVDYGRMSFEKVFTQVQYNGKNLIGWKKFGPRHPIEEQEWIYDEEDGGPVELRVKYDNTEGYVAIPIDKLAVFTFDKEGGDMRGFSALRSAYKNWFYKEQFYKIDAIQKERHAIGIPIIKLPPGYKESDKARAHEIGASLRTNESAHVVLDPMWEVSFAKLEGRLVNVLDSAQFHGNMIYENILGHFMVDVGSSRENTANQQMFIKSTKFLADQIADIFNTYCIPQLIDLNFEVERYPQLKVRRIGETTDWRSISFAVRNFVGAAMLTPDERMETWVRDEMDMPRAEPETARMVVPKQLPGQPGGNATSGAVSDPGPTPGSNPTPELPRQSTASNQNIGVGNVGRVGQDVAGS